jgi:dolichol-phosphate mannosyltransferase
MMHKNSLTIAVPFYNEEDSIKNFKNQLDSLLNKLKDVSVKVLLVDDGSYDNTYSLLHESFHMNEDIQLVQHSNNQNLGGFFKTCQNLCTTDYIVFLDSDCTFDPMLILEMIKTRNFGQIDIINGSPFHPNGSLKGVKKSRSLLSKISNLSYRLLINRNVYTYTSIFKMYKSSVFKKVQIKTIGFVSVCEVFVKCLLNGASVVEFPCNLELREYGESKIRILQSVKNHFLFLSKLIFIKLKFIKL